MTGVPDITVNNGVRIPQLGFGVFKIEPDETVEATLRALDIGYRHIDTAQMYRNEREVGRAVRESGIPRGDVFVTSKLDNDAHAYKDALVAFERTLEDLGFDYVDLFLIHWPAPDRGDYVETWRAMEEIYHSGRARAIGVSHFTVHHLRKLFDRTEVVPAVNQIELHPYLTQESLRAFNVEHAVATGAWSPTARGRLLEDSTVAAVAERTGRSPAQVVLRWHVQCGNIVFPASAALSRAKENFALFDFELSEQDMASIRGLNRYERTGPDPDPPDSFCAV